MLTIFDYDPALSSMRTFTQNNGNIWFHATDVCRILRYDTGNTSRIVAEKCEHEYDTISAGVGRPALYVSEAGLYMLIFDANTVFAKDFKRWVCKDVLPNLRKDGMYIVKPDNDGFASLGIFKKAESQLDKLLDDMDKSHGDPVALSHIAKSITAVSGVMSRNKPVTEKALKAKPEANLIMRAYELGIAKGQLTNRVLHDAKLGSPEERQLIIQKVHEAFGGQLSEDKRKNKVWKP